MNPITMKLQADKLIRMALEEDITSEDVSTNAVMPAYQKGRVQLIAKQEGVICGLNVFLRTFEILDPATTAEFYARDGEEIQKGQLLAELTGDIRVLLSGAGRAQLFAADERRRDVHPRDGEIAGRDKDQTSGYPQDHPQHARFRKIRRAGGGRKQSPL